MLHVPLKWSVFFLAGVPVLLLPLFRCSWAAPCRSPLSAFPKSTAPAAWETDWPAERLSLAAQAIFQSRSQSGMVDGPGSRFTRIGPIMSCHNQRNISFFSYLLIDCILLSAISPAVRKQKAAQLAPVSPIVCQSLLLKAASDNLHLSSAILVYSWFLFFLKFRRLISRSSNDVIYLC